MYIYLILLASVLVLTLVASYIYPDRQKRDNLILRVGIVLIYLVLALKKFTVGIDISGYKQQYLLSAEIPWLDVDYVYFEPGYITYMKIFSKLNIDFQWFMAATYLFVCIALYFFIKKYSKNVTLSLVIFICYQFMVFYISGVRQTIATAICMFAYMALDRKKGNKAVNTLLCVGLILLASTFHESSLIFFIVIPFAFIEFKKSYFLFYIPFVLSAAFFRSYILRFIGIFFGRINTSGDINLQGNFYFLVLICIFSIVAITQYREKNIEERNFSKIDRDFLFFVVNMFLLTIIFQIFFSGETILRATMYLTIFLIPGLTNVLKCYENKIEIVSTWVLLLVFIYTFVNDTLLSNQLSLCPYLFFWQ